ncbi:MFS transporter [Bacillaceae bacterium Marseille-Q3522]|nr:MFS transporter [Bacillaceae bacterium Marseille-Q3522]
MKSSFFKEEKQYRKLFLAGVVNGVGDRFSQVAMLTLLLQITGSGFAVGMTMALRLLPFLLFGPIGGTLADRISRKKILVVTDLARIVFALSFLLVHTKEDIWIVYVSSFILASGEAIYAPTRKASIPLLVANDHFQKVNSMEQVLIGIVLIGGAFSGGIVSYFFGPDMTFWFNGVSFLVAAWLISTIDFPEAEREAGHHKKQRLRVSSLKKIILLSIPLQVILLSEILIPLVNGIDNVLISVYAVEIFHLEDIGVGMFYGALGIGFISSFSVANRTKKHFLLSGIICLIMEGLMMILLSQSYAAALAFLLFCCTAFFSGVGNACFDTVLMKEIPDEHRGMMFGFTAALANTLLGVSMFFAGSALEMISPRLLGFLGGAAYIVIAVLLILIYAIKKSRINRNSEKAIEN